MAGLRRKNCPELRLSGLNDGTDLSPIDRWGNMRKTNVEARC
jgi:hypothetical protein